MAEERRRRGDDHQRSQRPARHSRHRPAPPSNNDVSIQSVSDWKPTLLAPCQPVNGLSVEVVILEYYNRL